MTDAVPARVTPVDAYATARRSPSVTLAEHERQPDMKRMRAYRMARVQAELRTRDYAGGSNRRVAFIKLTECALVTRDGYQLLSTFPYEERLIG